MVVSKWGTDGEFLLNLIREKQLLKHTFESHKALQFREPIPFLAFPLNTPEKQFKGDSPPIEIGVFREEL
jgi:hypothetical protein